MTARVDHSPAPAPFIVGLVLVSSALLFALGMDVRLNVYDEGVILTGAMRVAAGEVPHRDFYANYGPATFFLPAALFKIFGQYALIERVLDTLTRAGIVTLCYALCATQARTSIALATALISGLWLFRVPLYGYPIFPVVFLSLVSCALVMPALSGVPNTRRLAGAGATVGVIALFRYDAGFFIFVAIACALIVSVALVHANRRERLRCSMKMLVPYVLGTSIVFLPAAACYLAVAPVGTFIHDVFSYPLQYYARMRGLPFPRAVTPLYLPIAACSVAAYSLAHGHTNSQHGDGSNSLGSFSRWRRSSRFVLLLSLIVGALYLKGLVRLSIEHVLASLIPSTILVAVLLERSLRQGRTMQALAGSVFVFALAASLYGSVNEAKQRHREAASILDRIMSPATPRPCAAHPEIPSIACFSMEPDRVEVTRFLIQNTTPGERIFVGLTRHDKIYANDTLTYFAAARLPATRWHHFDPGLQTRADVQSDIVAELQARELRYIVLLEWEDVMEPNDSAKSSGVRVLDDYIRQHYRPIKSYGGLSILLRDP
jgi:hypothetical protein